MNDDIDKALHEALERARKVGYAYELVAHEKLPEVYCVFERKKICCQGSPEICLLYLEHYANHPKKDQ